MTHEYESQGRAINNNIARQIRDRRKTEGIDDNTTLKELIKNGMSEKEAQDHIDLSYRLPAKRQENTRSKKVKNETNKKPDTQHSDLPKNLLRIAGVFVIGVAVTYGLNSIKSQSINTSVGGPQKIQVQNQSNPDWENLFCIKLDSNKDLSAQIENQIRTPKVTAMVEDFAIQINNGFKLQNDDNNPADYSVYKNGDHYLLGRNCP